MRTPSTFGAPVCSYCGLAGKCKPCKLSSGDSALASDAVSLCAQAWLKVTQTMSLVRKRMLDFEAIGNDVISIDDSSNLRVSMTKEDSTIASIGLLMP